MPRKRSIKIAPKKAERHVAEFTLAGRLVRGVDVDRRRRYHLSVTSNGTTELLIAHVTNVEQHGGAYSATRIEGIAEGGAYSATFAAETDVSGHLRVTSVEIEIADPDDREHWYDLPSSRASYGAPLPARVYRASDVLVTMNGTPISIANFAAQALAEQQRSRVIRASDGTIRITFDAAALSPAVAAQVDAMQQVTASAVSGRRPTSVPVRDPDRWIEALEDEVRDASYPITAGGAHAWLAADRAVREARASADDHAGRRPRRARHAGRAVRNRRRSGRRDVGAVQEPRALGEDRWTRPLSTAWLLQLANL